MLLVQRCCLIHSLKVTNILKRRKQNISVHFYILLNFFVESFFFFFFWELSMIKVTWHILFFCFVKFHWLVMTRDLISDRLYFPIISGQDQARVAFQQDTNRILIQFIEKEFHLFCWINFLFIYSFFLFIHLFIYFIIKNIESQPFVTNFTALAILSDFS